MTERWSTRDLIWEEGHTNSRFLWSLTTPRWKEEVYLNIDTAVSCTRNLPLQPLSLLAWLPLLLQIPCPALLSISQQSNPGKEEGGTKNEEGVDGQDSPVCPHRDLHESLTEAKAHTPSFYYSTSPAPALLSSSNQHLELSRKANVASGIKAASVTTSNSWARSDGKI